MKKFLWMSAVALLALTPSIAVAMPQTLILLNSQPGDYIGQGLQQTFTPADGTLTASALANGGVQVSFHNSDFSQFWFLNFGPPSPQKIVASEYEGAQRFAFHSPTRPGLDVFGDGRGCNNVTGRFLVSDFALNVDGTLARFAVDFEQHCEGANPALYGSVRYNSGSKVAPRLGVGDATALKGNAGVSDASIMVSLSMPSSSTVSVQYATADGSAVQGTDYIAAAGGMSFPPNVTSQKVIVPILGDRLVRGGKTFYLRLSSPAGATLGDKSASVKILDPNGPITVLSMYGQPGDFISPTPLLFTIADGTLTPSLNPDNGISVALRSLDSWGTDFAGPDKAFLFAGSYLNAQRYPFQPAGIPGMDIAGAGRGCNTLTGNFTVTQTPALLNGKVLHFGADFEQHCEGFAPALFGSIRINSRWRQVSVGDAVIDTVNSSATFTVTLNPPSNTSVFVGFATADGTALAGVDYAATSQTVAFSAGETAHTVTVPLLANSAGKVFYGQLSSPSGAALWIGRASATF